MARKRRPRKVARVIGARGVRLVTTAEAAYIMGVSPRTFTTIVAERQITPAGVIGNAHVFYEDEVRAVRRKLYG